MQKQDKTCKRSEAHDSSSRAPRRRSNTNRHRKDQRYMHGDQLAGQPRGESFVVYFDCFPGGDLARNKFSYSNCGASSYPIQTRLQVFDLFLAARATGRRTNREEYQLEPCHYSWLKCLRKRKGGTPGERGGGRGDYSQSLASTFAFFYCSRLFNQK